MPQELRTLSDFIDQQSDLYSADPDAAKALSSAGKALRPEHLDFAEHAAWTAFANVMLNHDETITRN